ncbi:MULTISPECIES: hypothetical protein [Bacillus]|uniref:hypothetical protein n=1 Tax=Bacillus TaxID=1386 RepID=UPI000BB860EE|nr:MULTISPECIES: hypothetical protein [Bacillus]
MDSIHIGPIVIQKYMIVLLFAILVAYLYITIMLFKQKEVLKKVEDHLVSTLLLWILVFKFSIILFRPSIIWTNPLGLIYFTGGTNGMYLASIVSILFFYILARYKSKLDNKTIGIIVIPTIGITYSLYYILMNLF